ARRADDRRTPVPDAERHRSDFACVRRPRRSVRRTPGRHVRLRPLGRRRAPPVSRARSARQEAALLLAPRSAVSLRVGAQGALLPPGGRPLAGLGRAASLPRLRLHAGDAVDLRLDQEAAVGPYADLGRRTSDAAPLLAIARRRRVAGIGRRARRDGRGGAPAPATSPTPPPPHPPPRRR